jgi:hypothetical protein
MTHMWYFYTEISENDACGIWMDMVLNIAG